MYSPLLLVVVVLSIVISVPRPYGSLVTVIFNHEISPRSVDRGFKSLASNIYLVFTLSVKG